jgi:hypothetical protein
MELLLLLFLCHLLLHCFVPKLADTELVLQRHAASTAGHHTALNSPPWDSTLRVAPLVLLL